MDEAGGIHSTTGSDGPELSHGEGTGLRGASVEPDRDRVDRILKERARKLARPPDPPPPTDNLEVVVFVVGRETYGIEAALVQEVFRLTGRSVLPGAPEPIAGVTAHRGELLTLLDLRARLGLRRSALDDLSRVFVLRRERTRFGVLVDRMEGLRVVRASELGKPRGLEGAHQYIRGVTADVMAVLDADAIIRSFDGGDAS